MGIQTALVRLDPHVCCMEDLESTARHVKIIIKQFLS